MYILGLSGFYHDSAAALLRDGDIVAAAQEERFTRKKHDSSFPGKSIEYCLQEAGITLADVDYVVFYDKPLLKFERLLQTYVAKAPKGFSSFFTAMPVWIKEKIFLKQGLIRSLEELSGIKKEKLPPLLFTEHHQSHAASAFFPSPFEDAAVLCLDGVGEWATSSVWHGRGNKLDPLWEIRFPHSLGLLYSAFTYYTGFKVNSGEYKVMGLAPYGEPKYKQLILDNLIDIKDDGTFKLDQSYFNYTTGLTMTNKKFDKLFGGPPRKPESQLTQREMDLARSVQEVTEEVVLQLAKTIHRETGAQYLCMAGGVALNCVANGRLLREGPFKDIWIQPAAGDAGGALGAALSAHYEYLDKPRVVRRDSDSMKGSYLGPGLDAATVKKQLDAANAKYEVLSDDALRGRVADVLAEGNIVGWVQGRMEFGPRALGGRSIIGDPRNPKMQSAMNLKIKYRESFRPFAPAVKGEDVSKYFDLDRPSPYMLIVAPVEASRRRQAKDAGMFGIEKLKALRSEIPAVTHVDYSARVQTVHQETNPKFYKLIDAFKNKTGCSVLVNTSFNVRGEPIVCDAADAYRCFMRTEMDYLVVENFLIAKSDQPKWHETQNWQSEYELD